MLDHLNWGYIRGYLRFYSLIICTDHLKSLCLRTSEEVNVSSNNLPDETADFGIYAFEATPSYSEFDEPQRVYHTIFLKNAPNTEIKTEAYFYAPVK